MALEQVQSDTQKLEVKLESGCPIIWRGQVLCLSFPSLKIENNNIILIAIALLLRIIFVED